jgi:hypothetical protein
MAVISGKSGSVYYGTDEIGELSSYTLTVTQNTEESFSFGSSWVTNTATSKSWSVEASGFHDPNDSTGQAAVITDILTGDSTVSIALRSEGDTAGDDEYTGSIVLQEVSVEAAADGLISFSFSGIGNGTLTKGTVS